MRKLLFIIVLVPLLGGLGWWYFREQPLPNYGPAYREYAYVTNGKSNSVSVIDLRTFEPAKTIPVGVNPTGIAANRQKNEIYVVNSGSNNVSVIDAEKNAVVAAIGVHGKPYFIDVSEDGKHAYVANSGSANVSFIDLEKRVVVGLFNRYCIRCHGPDGRGVWDMPGVPDFTNARWRDSRSEGQLARIILEGRGAVMPPFRGAVGLEEAWGLARYLRTLVPGSEVSRPDFGPAGGGRQPHRRVPDHPVPVRAHRGIADGGRAGRPGVRRNDAARPRRARHDRRLSQDRAGGREEPPGRGR